MNNLKRIHHLVEVARSYGVDTKYLSNKTESTDNEIIIELISVLYDGLVYGNWPPTPNSQAKGRGDSHV